MPDTDMRLDTRQLMERFKGLHEEHRAEQEDRRNGNFKLKLPTKVQLRALTQMAKTREPFIYHRVRADGWGCGYDDVFSPPLPPGNDTSRHNKLFPEEGEETVGAFILPSELDKKRGRSFMSVTLKCLERDGWIRRAHRHREVWKDDRVLTDVARSILVDAPDLVEVKARIKQHNASRRARPAEVHATWDGYADENGGMDGGTERILMRDSESKTRREITIRY